MSESKTDETLNTELVPYDDKLALEKALEYWKSVKSIKITTQSEYDNAFEVCKELKIMSGKLEGRRVELKKPWDNKANYVQGEFKPIIDSLVNGEKELKKAMVHFHDQEQHRIEAEEKRRAAEAEEARKKAMEAAKKEQEKAEQYRQDGREEMAQKAEARAEFKAEQASSITHDVVESQTKKKGAGFSESFVAQITDSEAFIKFVAENPLYENCIEIKVKQIEKLQNAHNGKLSFPGINFQRKTTMSMRTK